MIKYIKTRPHSYFPIQFTQLHLFLEPSYTLNSSFVKDVGKFVLMRPKSSFMTTLRPNYKISIMIRYLFFKEQ